MEHSIVFEVAVPTFLLLIAGIGLTIHEFHKVFRDNDTKHEPKKTTKKIKQKNLKQKI